MSSKYPITQKPLNPWHFIWISVVVSELFTAFLTTIQYTLYMRTNLAQLLMVGAIDALFVPLLIVPIILYFSKKRVELEEFNRQLQQEIAERKSAEESLRESEDKFRSIFEQTSDGIMIADAETKRHIMANRAICAMLGYNRDEIVGLSVDDIHPKENLPAIRCLFEKQLRGEMSLAPEVPILRKDGSVFYADINASILNLVGKQCLVGIFRDITERKQAEEKLRKSEAFIRKILDAVDEGFIVIDRDYRILTANKAYGRLVGKCDEEIVGQHCYEVSHKSNRPCYEDDEDCAPRRVFETGNPYSSFHRYNDAKGNLLYIENKAFPIKNGSGTVTSVIETINNITEKHLLEEERLKMQKLESIGTLAGGIAHDFNNLLQGVFGYLSLAKMTAHNREKSTAALEQAEKALHQSVNLTNQLLTFSKGGKPLKKLFDLRPIIENSAQFTLSGSRANLHMNFPENLWQAEADGGQLSQVIQNIVLNADQSMPVGGTVTVTAANVAKGDASLPPGLEQRDYVMIAIQDTGIGISEQYLSMIFDPYFTTKEKGSGLGLATSYSIVRNHGGMIDIKTKLGVGTAFMIYLPAIAGHVLIESAEKLQELSQSRKAKVLVMDDEEVIRNIGGELLGALGHDVEVAKHGKEVLEKYQGAIAAGSPFDIVILDLTIRGGMGGVEAFQQLLKIDPHVKAVVSSGYSDDATTANYVSQGFKASLKKPYDVSALREVLNKVLNG